MNVWPARRDRWARFQPDQQVGLLEDDLDKQDAWNAGQNKKNDEMIALINTVRAEQQAGFSRITWYLMGLLGSGIMACILLAVNVLLGR